MLKISNLSIKYDKVILDYETINIPIGRITLIKGDSGIGKTALLYRIALISDDQSFKFECDDKEIKDHEQFRQDNISFVLQSIDFFPHYSLYETMKYFAKVNGTNMNKDKAHKLLEKVHLDNNMHQNVMSLSLGEKQRLSILCALIKQPSLLVLDEPTASLDQENEIIIFEILKNLANDGMTIVIASHSDMADIYADQIYIIDDTHLKLIKNATNDESFNETKQHHIGQAFLRNYAIHYMKSYRFIYVFLIMILTLSLLSGSIFLLLSDYAKTNSVELLQEQFDNYLIITNDENKYVDLQYTSYMTSCDEDNAYPLYQMTATLNNEEIDIIPYFEDNNLNNHLSSYLSENENGVYMDAISYYAYQNLIDQSISITITDQDNQYITSKQLTVNGVLQNSYEQHYSTESQRFIYMNYDMMKDIYESINGSHQYIGYVIIYDSFNQLKAGKSELENQGYTINDTFTDIDVLNALINYYLRLQVIVSSVIITLTFIIDIILISHIHLQKRKENNILRISGLSNKHLFQLDIYEYMIEIMISIAIASLTILIVAFITGAFSLQRILLIIGMQMLLFVILLIERIFITHKELHNNTIEKVLRESEG